jgi:hypothetical protein
MGRSPDVTGWCGWAMMAQPRSPAKEGEGREYVGGE